MLAKTTQMSYRRSVPLSIRISFALILAAILPLLVTLFVSEMQIRPMLTNQASKTLETDAQTHTQLIDSYISGKLLEVKSLAYTPISQQFLLNPVLDAPNTVQLVRNGLAINKSNDPEQILASFFTLKGKFLLSYSTYNLKAIPHGKYMIPPEDMQNLLKSKTLQTISDVYMNPVLQKPTIDLYTAVFSTQLKKIIGIVRNTMTLDVIWSIVKSETGANGSGSYAFILDKSGVRIVDPDLKSLYTSIQPLSVQQQQTIKDENRYGVSNVRTLADTTLTGTSNSFVDSPVEKTEQYQFTRHTLTSIPWTYYVSTPTNTVVAVANEQLVIILIIALVVLIPIAFAGLVIGNWISAPISRSVETLLASGTALNQFSEKEKGAASEQVWIVDASEVGFKSIRYYTDASKMAVQRLNELGKELLEGEYRDRRSTLAIVSQMVSIGQYFEKAVTYQDKSNAKVEVALNVTNQVAEQLEADAKSVSEASKDINRVVNQLRHIIGS